MPPPDNTQFGKLYDFRDIEKVYNKIEEDKLKSPAVQPSPSPFFTTDKHIIQVPANQSVFDKISSRLNAFNPKIRLSEHIVHNPERVNKLREQRFYPVVAGRNTLIGIDFVVEDAYKLLRAVEGAKADDGLDAFVKGTKHDWKKHWPLALSFRETKGIGYREIFRPKIIDRPIENKNKIPHDARLGKDLSLDVSALHVAVSDFTNLTQTRCNIHIDEMTVTLGGLGNNVTLSPTALAHIVNELWFKTKLEGKVPEWVIDAFDISIFDPSEGFFRMGIGATIINQPNFKWTFSASAGLNNSTSVEWSGDFKPQGSLATGITIRF